ncbi:HNH endonuclease family protein [Streptomyces sp. YIM 98790]|uniref:HNH endonuclease family protein n=1 Tax=Streptomyces sp. YIM 98790 TaxID=2689077 RepID=UPI00140BA0CB|nr:HNH endonuclease family protein [Streptomyces sp. YIM 98790]
MRVPVRPVAAGVTALVLGAALAGCAEILEEGSDEATATVGGAGQEDAAPGGEGGAGWQPVSKLPGLPAPSEGREMLAALAVADERPMTGYSRDEFPHWSRQDGCTVRQTVLLRDGNEVKTGDDCQPDSGEWYSVYDGQTLTSAGDVDIDHMVPLAAAWRSGADEWDRERREAFANDLENPQLIAVSASSNRSKGDQDPADWQPVEEYWCEYGLAWTAVKDAWDLTVHEDEREMLGKMLDTCPA